MFYKLLNLYSLYTASIVSYCEGFIEHGLHSVLGVVCPTPLSAKNLAQIYRVDPCTCGVNRRKLRRAGMWIMTIVSSRGGQLGTCVHWCGHDLAGRCMSGHQPTLVSPLIMNCRTVPVIRQALRLLWGVYIPSLHAHSPAWARNRCTPPAPSFSSSSFLPFLSQSTTNKILF